MPVDAFHVFHDFFAVQASAVAEPLSRDQTLVALLDANRDLPPDYSEGMTNHLPMALHALHAMGADAQRLRAFCAGYARRFEGRRMLSGAAPVADWRSLRGRGDERSYAALVATFEGAMAAEGEAAMLRRILPDLLPGVAAGAFHGVIRTAHALQSGHRAELVRALAYWAWRWQDLTLPEPPAAALPFEAWAQHLALQAAGQTFTAPLISLRIALATASPTYRALGAALAPRPQLLRDLAGLALSAYLESRNFTVLHMITGLRAIRVLQPWVEDAQALQPVLVRAFTAAYLAAQVKPMARRTDLHLSNWPEVIAAAIASDNDHVIKLVHACVEEFAVCGDPRYLAAAALATT